MKKPHIYRSRFLNHEEDSTVTRAYHCFKSMCRTIKKLFKYSLAHQKQKKVKLDRQEIYKNWMTPVTVPATSQQPIITWLGHATFLIQAGGVNILTDPSFFEISLVLPRITPSPIHPKDLPKIDVILISHNHPDHLNSASIKALKKYGHEPVVLTPLGIKKWFTKRNFKQIFEKNWWQEHTVNNTVKFTLLPAEHWSGRNLVDTNWTLWGSWMIEAHNFKIYFAGDSAYAEHFTQIGREFGSVDVALMPIAPNTPEELVIESHVSTDESVKAFGELNAQHFIPMHWGTFPFEQHAFDEPLQRLYGIWDKNKETLSNKHLHVLKIGQSQAFEKL